MGLTNADDHVHALRMKISLFAFFLPLFSKRNFHKTYCYKLKNAQRVTADAITRYNTFFAPRFDFFARIRISFVSSKNNV